MTKMLKANLVLTSAVFGTLAYASPPMHPGAGSAVMEVWHKSAEAQKHHASTNKNDGAYGSVDTEWEPTDWVWQRFAEYPLYGDGEKYTPSEDSDVMRRAREVQEEANQRWYGRRIESGTPVGGEWHPEEAGWVSPEGKPDATRWPWWMF